MCRHCAQTREAPTIDTAESSVRSNTLSTGGSPEPLQQPEVLQEEYIFGGLLSSENMALRQYGTRISTALSNSPERSGVCAPSSGLCLTHRRRITSHY
ncbi:hypothetical protein BDZ89DRAFT_1076042 [Hymenopellis radicata]|nr:hypothetical protein BDZ89DRAFT_1076042 [Hymenopellis radicata]